VEIEWIATVLSLRAIGFSIWTWIKLRPDEQRGLEGSSIDVLTELLIYKNRHHQRNVFF